MRKFWARIACGALVASIPLTTPSGVLVAAPVPTVGAVSRFVPVAPCRLADTRTSTGFTRLSPNLIRVSTAGRCGIGSSPSAIAASVVMVGPDDAGFVTLFPAGTEQPTASMLNFSSGQIRSNAAMVTVGTDGSFDVFHSAGGDLVIDTMGSFEAADASRSGRLVSTPPTRLLDTRDTSIVPPGGSVTIPLPVGVPADAVAMSLNVTVTESLDAGFVSTHPAGTPRPDSSVLNLDAAGQTRAAGGIHTVGPNGITIFLSGGGHVVVDSTGWFTGPSAALSSAGLFRPTAPGRILDTRQASPLGVGVALAGGSSVTIPSPGDAVATLAFNVTTVDGDPGYVTAFPAGTTRPTSSTLNARGGGDIAANFAIVPAGAGGLALFAQSTTHLVVDLAGSFSPASVDSFAPAPPTTAPPTTSPPTTAAPATTAAPTTVAPSTTAAPTTTTAPTGPRPIVYLTFDDGPVASASAAVMSLLEQYGIRGTFFLQGDFTTAMPAIAASTRARGHAIGNHTFNHLDLRTLTDAQIQSELRTAQDAIATATGFRPTCMRPPYGYIDPFSGPPVTPLNTNVRNVINGEHLAITMWTHDTNDWNPATTVTQIVGVLNSLPTAPGSASTVLFHDRSVNMLTALQQWLPANIGRYDFRMIPTC